MVAAGGEVARQTRKEEREMQEQLVEPEESARRRGSG
jgi:hypothetical protein